MTSFVESGDRPHVGRQRVALMSIPGPGFDHKHFFGGSVIAPTRLVTLAIACAADGRTKYVIAAEAGCAPNLLSAFISGRRAPTSEQVVRLARVLNVAPESISPDYVYLGGDT